MNIPKVSIIMPVYQREAFLHDSIKCILDQSYNDYELICVDDGSTDNSGKICDEYAAKDSRIHVIHQKNKGTNIARHEGIKISQGEFLCFIDSDDYVDREYLDRLTQWAEISQADIVITGIRLLYPEGKTENMFSAGEEGSLEKKDALLHMVGRKDFGWELVGKLYKRTLFDDINCSESIRFAEDLLTNWEIFYKAETFYYNPYVGYSYYRHGGNMTLNADVRRADTVMAYDSILKGRLYSPEIGGDILKIIERDLSDIMVSWALSGELVDSGFCKLQETLNVTLSEEKRLGIKPDREYLELKCNYQSANSIYEEIIEKVIENIIQFCHKHKKVYVFGCGTWALRVSMLLDINNVRYDGFVVTELQNVNSSQVRIKEDVNELKDIDSNSGVIICVSEKVRDEVLSFCYTFGISQLLDLSGESQYIRYILESPLVIRKNPEIQTILKNCSPVWKQNHRDTIIESRAGFGLGGIEAWAKDICKGLTKRGYKDIHVLSRENRYKEDLSEIVDIVEECDSTVEYCKKLLNYYLNNIPCLFISSQPTEELLVATMIKEYFPDAINIISVIHGGHPWIYDKYKPYLSYADKVVAVSKRIKGDLISRGIIEDRIIIKPALFSFKKDGARLYNTDRSKPISIGYAGRIEYSQKRADLLMKLIEELKNRDIDFRFEIAGDGVALEDLEKFVRDNGLKDNVKLVGVLENKNMPDFWMRQDIAVNLADFEGHSISQMEAMAGGAVPVVTDTSGVDDDITDGENGFIVAVGDYMSAADRIENLFDNREMIVVMGKKARCSIIEKGDYEKFIDYWEELCFHKKKNI